MGDGEHLSHAEFALRVLSASADPRRIADVIAHIVGERIDIRSLRVGPGGVCTASALGIPGPVDAQRSRSRHWDVDVAVPVHLNVRVNIAGAIASYLIAVRVYTRIRLVPIEPCAVFVEIEEVREEQVDAVVSPRGMPSRLVGWVGKINAVVGAQVLAYINDLFASDEVLAVRRIDVERMLARSWEAGFVVELPGRDAVQKLRRREGEGTQSRRTTASTTDIR